MEKQIKKELDCYMANSIVFKYDSIWDKYFIEKPLQFIPLKLAYTEEEIKTLIKIFNGGKVKITKELCEAREEVDKKCFIISKLEEYLDREIAICKCNKQVMETIPDMTFSNEWWYRIKIYDEIKDKLNEYKKESLKYEQEQREKETK